MTTRQCVLFLASLEISIVTLVFFLCWGRNQIFSPIPDGRVQEKHIKDAMASEANTIDFKRGAARFSLVRVPAGEFELCNFDSRQQPSADKVVRRIRISRAFYLGQFEVTQLQYKAVMGKLPLCKFPGDSLPVHDITY